MSKPISIDIRSPANRGFVQGYPGIPVSSRTEPRRPPCTVSGTVEVQAIKGLKAVSLKISLVKRETLPSDAGVTSFCEDVSPAVVLWSCSPNEDHGVFESVKVFPFSINLPPFLPPTIELTHEVRTRAPNGRPVSLDVSRSDRRPPGIGYYLEVTLLERAKKKGLLRKEIQGTEKAVQPIEIWPHDLHSDWPVYNVPKTVSAQGSQVYMALTLPQTSFSPSSTLSLPFALYPLPSQTQPVALKHITLTLMETVTFQTSSTSSVSSSGPSKLEATPGALSGRKSLSRPTSSPVVTVVAQSRTEIPNDSIFPEDKSGKLWNLMLKLPPSASADASTGLLGRGGSSGGRASSNGLRWTVRNGRHVDVKFYLGVEVWGIKGYQTQLLGSIKDVEVVIDWEEVGEAKRHISEIGYVESLCGRNRGFATPVSTSVSTPSSNIFEPSHPASSTPTLPLQGSGYFPPNLAPSPLPLSPRSSVVRPTSQVPHSAGFSQPTSPLPRHSLSQSSNNHASTAMSSVGSSWEIVSVVKDPTEQGIVTGPSTFGRGETIRTNGSPASSPASRRASLMNGSSRAVSGPLAVDRMRDLSMGTRRSASVSIGRPPDLSSSSSSVVNSPLPSPSLSTTTTMTTATKTAAIASKDMDSAYPPAPRPPNFNKEDDHQPTYQTAEQEKAMLFQRARLAASSLSANTAPPPTVVPTVPPFSPQFSPSSAGPSSSQSQPPSRSQPGRSSGPVVGNQDSPQVFESAEQEKRRLFLEAQRRVNETHAGAVVAHPQTSVPVNYPSRDMGSTSNAGGSEPEPSSSKWETAEQEKARLFQEAKNRVAATQAGGGGKDLMAASSSSSSSPSFPYTVPSSSGSVTNAQSQATSHRFSSMSPAVTYAPPNESHRLSPYIGSTSQLGSLPDGPNSIKPGGESVGRGSIGLTDSSEEGREEDGLMSYESLFGKQDGNGTGEPSSGGSRNKDVGNRMSTTKVTSEKDRLKLFHAAQEAVAIRHSQPAASASSSSSQSTTYNIPLSSTGYTSPATPIPEAFPPVTALPVTTSGVTPVASKQKTIPPVLPVRPPVEYAAKYIDPALIRPVGK